jgi:hypothetical protein
MPAIEIRAFSDEHLDGAAVLVGANQGSPAIVECPADGSSTRIDFGLTRCFERSEFGIQPLLVVVEDLKCGRIYVGIETQQPQVSARHRLARLQL